MPYDLDFDIVTAREIFIMNNFLCFGQLSEFLSVLRAEVIISSKEEKRNETNKFHSSSNKYWLDLKLVICVIVFFLKIWLYLR